MPLRYSQLRGQDPDHDLVSLEGLYNAENSVVGKGTIDDLDFDDWNNWMQWDVGTTELVTPGEAFEDNTANSLCSLETYFSDLDSPVPNGRTSIFSEEEPVIEGAPFDIDEETESMLFSPISTNTPSPINPRPCNLRTAPQLTTKSEDGVFLEPHETDHISSEMKRVPVTKPARMKMSRPLQVDASARRGRKRKVSTGSELDTTCLSKKRGHNAIEKRYRTNLNEKINCLRSALPGEDDYDDDDTQNRNGQQKVGKAAVLTRALEYIKHLECNTQRLGKEIDALKLRVGAFERLAKSETSIEGNDMAILPTLSCGLTLKRIQEGFTQAKRSRF